MKPKPPLEKTEQAAIVRTLRALGWDVYVLGHPSPRDGRRFRGTGQTPGIPDLLAFGPERRYGGPLRRMVWIECKRQGGKLRIEQVAFRHQCVEAGVDHIVGTAADVRAWLVREGYVKEAA